MSPPLGAFLVSEIFPTAPAMSLRVVPTGWRQHGRSQHGVSVEEQQALEIPGTRRRADNANVLIRNRVRGAGAPPVRFQRRLFLRGLFGFLGFLGFFGFFGFLAAAGCAAAGAKGQASPLAAARSTEAIPRPRSLSPSKVFSRATSLRACCVVTPKQPEFVFWLRHRHVRNRNVAYSTPMRHSANEAPSPSELHRTHRQVFCTTPKLALYADR